MLTFFFLCAQTALKLLARDDEELLKTIPIILGCRKENIKEGSFIEIDETQDIVNLVKETSYSHLIEASDPLIMCLMLSLFYPIHP